MHSCFALATLTRESSDAVGTALEMVSTGTGVSLQLNATDPAMLGAAGTKSSQGYLSPVFDLIASAFVRYRVTRLVFHYEPQCSATSTERMVFAFAADPLHPVLWNATPPGSSALLSLADSVAFAPWRAWSLDVSRKLSKEELYTFSDASLTVGTFTERFSDFGVISCVTSSVSGVKTACGVLYAEIEMELKEFCPVSLSRPAMASSLLPKLAVHLESAQSGSPKEEQPREEAKETPRNLFHRYLSERQV
jgi:hypothetical protein